MAALNIARDAINGSSDMAANIRTEHDAELDMIELRRDWKELINKLRILLTLKQN